MTTERIDIIVTENGSRTVRRNIEDIGVSAKNAAGPMQLLKGLLKTYIGFETLNILRQTVDTFNNFQNRLKLVTTSTGQLNAVTQKLFDIANKTRSAFSTTGEVFSRLALQAGEAGFSSGQLLTITENLNKAVILSGASTVEATAALVQLSQGFASNRLSGDELRSVLEQLPLVAQLIAKEMNITTGELRKLGEQGKITANIVGNALLKATERLDGQFAKTSATIAQAFNILKNSFIKAIGDFDKATGASKLFADALVVVAKNIDLVTIAAIGLFSRGLIASSIEAVTGLVRKLAQSLAVLAVVGGLEIGGIAVAFNAARIAGFGFFTAIAKATAPALLAGLSAIGSVLSVVLLPALLLGVAAAVLFRDRFIEIVDYFGGDGKRVFEGIALVVDGTSQLIIGLANGALTVIQGLFLKLEITILEARNRVKRFLGQEEIDIVTYLGLDDAGKIEAASSTIGQNFARGFANGAASGTNLLGDFYNDQLAKEFPKDDLGGGAGTPKGVIDEKALKRQQKLLKEILGPAFELKQTLSDLNALYDAGKISLEQYNDKMLDLNIKLLETDKTISGGIQRGLLNLQREFQNLSTLAEKTIVDAFHGAEDALVEFVTTGKLNFRSLVSSILADLARLEIRRSVTGPLLNALTSALGSIGSGGFSNLFASGLNNLGFGQQAYSMLDGYATGAEFKVGGSGGTDSQVVAFRASPDETVSVRTPGQQRDAAGGGGQAFYFNYEIDARGAEQGVEEKINQALTQARPIMVREAVAAVRDGARRSSDFFTR